MAEGIRIERVIDLSRAIVWDAFIDPVLVAGWFHPVAPIVANETLRDLREPAEGEPYVVDSVIPELGRLRVELTELPGGTRGHVTNVAIVVPGPVLQEGRDALVAAWEARLDDLAQLLRGHPVDWTPATADALVTATRAALAQSASDRA